MVQHLHVSQPTFGLSRLKHEFTDRFITHLLVGSARPSALDYPELSIDTLDECVQRARDIAIAVI